MKAPFFKSEDFERLNKLPESFPLSWDLIADHCNAKLEEYLKTLPMVDLLDYEWQWTTQKVEPGVYKIWDIQEIEK